MTGGRTKKKEEEERMKEQHAAIHTALGWMHDDPLQSTAVRMEKREITAGKEKERDSLKNAGVHHSGNEYEKKNKIKKPGRF